MLANILKSIKAMVVHEKEPQGERRDMVRVRCRVPVTVHADTESMAGTVLDMHTTGVRLKTNQPPWPARTPVTLEYVEDAEDGDVGFEVKAIRCYVSWSRHRKFSHDTISGLIFLEDPETLEQSWVNAVLIAAGVDEDTITRKRDTIRADCTLTCDLFGEHGERLGDGAAVNLSLGGVQIQFNERLPRDTRVKVRIGPYEGLPEVDLWSTVVSSRLDASHKCYHVSLRFIGESEERNAQVGKYIHRLIQETSALF